MINTHPKTNRTAQRGNITLTRIVAILLSLLCVSTSLLSGMIARYTTSSASSDSASVAAWVFDVSNGSALIPLSSLTAPGDSATCSISVMNSSHGVTSEVAESYNLSIKSVGNMPLTFSMQEASSEGDPALADLAESGTIGGPVALSDNGCLLAAVNENKTYTLSLSWPEDRNTWANNSTSLANLQPVAYLYLSVDAVQID